METHSLPGLSPALKEQYRQGFYENQGAPWLEDVVDQSHVRQDFMIRQRLEELARGRRGFTYPDGHDQALYPLLEGLIQKNGLRRGAEVGSGRGSYIAMQLHLGIQEVSTFELYDRPSDDPRVRVIVHDLSQGPYQGEPFDLITCISTIEHVGLGRYGDRVDPDGDIKLFGNLLPLLKPRGYLVVSLPEGKGCVHYNLQRIYNDYRRDRLFKGFHVERKVDTRSFARRLGNALLGRRFQPGWAYQPIYVLRRG